MLGLASKDEIVSIRQLLEDEYAFLCREIAELKEQIAKLESKTVKTEDMPPGLLHPKRVPWRYQRDAIEQKLRTPDRKNPLDQFVEAERVHNESGKAL